MNLGRTPTIAAVAVAAVLPLAGGTANGAEPCVYDEATGFCLPPGETLPDAPVEAEPEPESAPEPTTPSLKPKPYTAPIPVATGDVQVLVNHVTRFLRIEYGLKVAKHRPRVVQVRNSLAMDGHAFPHAGALVDTDSGRMAFRTPVAVDVKYLTLARRYNLKLKGAPGRPVPIRVNGARTAIHEVLHLVSPRAGEGIVEAVSIDLTPRFLRYYLGRGVAFNRSAAAWHAYPEGVFRSWKVSRAKTRSKSPFTRQAERERIRLLVRGWRP